MVTKGWCEDCQFQNRDGVLYCSQCGEELQNKSQRGRQIMAVVLLLIIVTGLILTYGVLFNLASINGE
jgi:predicted nucleic acid-binding Zn ribbon protein